MRILQVASEAVPLVKTGGLADVVTALSQALGDAGDDVRLLMPAYGDMLERVRPELRLELGDPLGVGPARLWSTTLPGSDVKMWLLQCDPLFRRPGGPYLDAAGHDHPDNHLRFAMLSRAAAMAAIASPALGWPVDVVHAHDWQAALTPAYLSWWGTGRPATVLTVHNLQFAGRFPPSILPSIAVPPSAYAVDGLEFYGEVSYLKAGLYYADRVTTVSPTYADEIRTPEGGKVC
jgi:starch synthase